MKNLKIGLRLALGFGVVMLLMVAITFIGLSRLAAQNNGADHIVNNLYLKAEAGQHISFISVDTARLVRNLILHTDANNIASDSAALNKNKRQLADRLDQLDKAIDTDTGRDLMKVITANQVAYLSFTTEVTELAIKNDNMAATAVLYGPKYHYKLAA